MSQATKYDCIVIGGGHNGLITAAYLARAGKRVCVLERRAILGGAACSEELWPGFKVSTGAYVISLLLPRIIGELRLEHHGLKILSRSPSSFTPFPDGRSLLLGPKLQQNQAEVRKFSPRDADAYPHYEAFLNRVARVVQPVLETTAPDPLPLGADWRKRGLAKKLRDGRKGWEIYKTIATLAGELPKAIDLITGAALPVLDRWFESDELKATLAIDAIIGSFSSIHAPGSAYMLLHHVMGEAGGCRGVWGYVEGGMGRLADALEKAGMVCGVDIRREAEVRRILTHNGKAVGVELSDGTQVDAAAVASSVDAHLTFEVFLGPNDLPEYFRDAVADIDYSSASAKINLALSEPPQFTCAPGRGIGPHHHGTIHIAPSTEYLERAYDDAKYGHPSRQPILEITLPTSIDRTIAPTDQHIMSIFVQYAPYNLATGNWDQHKEEFADRCIDLLAEYAPNVPGAILHRQVLSPLDLERTFGLTGGNIFQGAMTPGQLFCLRPVAGWADHRTPIEGLYLCGAASHPGGGVMGACGLNAAMEILRDL